MKNLWRHFLNINDGQKMPLSRAFWLDRKKMLTVINENVLGINPHIYLIFFLPKPESQNPKLATMRKIKWEIKLE